MKKVFQITFTIILLVMVSTVNSQTVAVDFNQDECNGPSHHLYDELDEGKVIILEFVMLNCAPCIVGTKALDKIKSSYNETHPDRVELYSFGFLDSYTCEQMLAWINNNNFTHPVFTGGEQQVSYYGGMGMPTIVVIGTGDHKVFFKSAGYTAELDDEIKAAIDSALMYNPTGVDEKFGSDQFNAFPTMFTDNFHIDTDNVPAGSEAVLYNIAGKRIKTYMVPASGRITVSGTELTNGMYFIRLQSAGATSGSIRLIKQ